MVSKSWSSMTEENDKLIEEFWISQGGKANMKEDLWFYQSDWNMLMPVVEKIQKVFSFIPNTHYYDVTSFDIEWSSYPRKQTSVRISICTDLNGLASKFHTIWYKEDSKIEAVY